MTKQPKTIRLISICAMAVGFVFMLVGFLGGAKHCVTAGSNGVHIIDAAPHTSRNLSLAPFQSIDVDAGQANVAFVHSEQYGVDISYYGDTDPLEYAVENGTLKISKTPSQESRFSWLNLNFGFNKNQNKIQIYLPADVSLKNIKVQSSMGTVTLDGFTAENADIRLDFGNLQLRNAVLGDTSIALQNGSSMIQKTSVKSLSFSNDFGKSNFENINANSTKDSTIKAQNGQINITNLTSTGPLLLEDKFGGIRVDGMKAGIVKSTLQNGNYEILNSEIKDLTVDNSFGEIKLGSLASNGLNLKSKNGSISLDGTLNGISTIKSDHGKVNVKTLLALKQYNYDFFSSDGTIKINGQKQGDSVRINTGAENSLTISCGNGSINADFQP